MLIMDDTYDLSKSCTYKKIITAQTVVIKARIEENTENKDSGFDVLYK